MREILERQRVPGASPELCFQLLFQEQALKRAFHTSQGDKQIDLSEWIPAGDGSFRRMCFYTMVEENGDETRCMEVQQYKTTDADGEWRAQVDCAVTPENPMGNIFRIEAQWLFTRDRGGGDAPGCLITVKGEVECNTRIWGLQGMAEGVLYKQAQRTIVGLLSVGKERIAAHLRDNGAMSPSTKSDPYTSSLRMRSGPAAAAPVHAPVPPYDSSSPSLSASAEDGDRLAAVVIHDSTVGVVEGKKGAAADKAPTEKEEAFLSEPWCGCRPPVVLFVILLTSTFMAYIMFSFAI